MFGPLLVGMLAAGAWWDHRIGQAWATTALVVLFALAAQRETLELWGQALKVSLPRWVLLGTAAWFAARGLVHGLGWPPAFAALVFWVAVLVALVTALRGPVAEAPRRIGGVLAALGLAVALGELMGAAWRFSAPAALALALTIKLGDIGGYLVGRFLGRRRITPVLSPKKTLEGLVGGYLFSVAGGVWMFHRLFPEQWSLPALVGLAVVVNTAGFLGDLLESALKRAAGAKDSGHLLPEFGGALDMVDSLVLAAPLGHAWLQWTLQSSPAG